MRAHASGTAGASPCAQRHCKIGTTDHLRLSGQPSASTPGLSCSSFCLIESWQGAHNDCSAPSTNKFQSPRCGLMWSTTVARTTSPRSATERTQRMLDQLQPAAPLPIAAGVIVMPVARGSVISMGADDVDSRNAEQQRDQHVQPDQSDHDDVPLLHVCRHRELHPPAEPQDHGADQQQESQRRSRW